MDVNTIDIDKAKDIIYQIVTQTHISMAKLKIINIKEDNKYPGPNINFKKQLVKFLANQLFLDDGVGIEHKIKALDMMRDIMRELDANSLYELIVGGGGVSSENIINYIKKMYFVFLESEKQTSECIESEIIKSMKEK